MAKKNKKNKKKSNKHNKSSISSNASEEKENKEIVKSDLKSKDSEYKEKTDKSEKDINKDYNDEEFIESDIKDDIYDGDSDEDYMVYEEDIEFMEHFKIDLFKVGIIILLLCVSKFADVNILLKRFNILASDNTSDFCPRLLLAIIFKINLFYAFKIIIDKCLILPRSLSFAFRVFDKMIKLIIIDSLMFLFMKYQSNLRDNTSDDLQLKWFISFNLISYLLMFSRSQRKHVFSFRTTSFLIFVISLISK